MSGSEHIVDTDVVQCIQEQECVCMHVTMGMGHAWHGCDGMGWGWEEMGWDGIGIE
jgi:hypothetical protein